MKSELPDDVYSQTLKAGGDIIVGKTVADVFHPEGYGCPRNMVVEDSLGSSWRAVPGDKDNTRSESTPGYSRCVCTLHCFSVQRQVSGRGR